MKQKESYNSVKILSFLLPIIGLMIYAINVKKDNKLARMGIKWALIGMSIVPVTIIVSIWVYKHYDDMIVSNSQEYTETLKEQPINVIYNDKLFIIEILQDKVNITLKGTKTDVLIAKESCNAYVDLTKLKADNYNLQVDYNCTDTNVNYEIKPKTITVNICDKVSSIQNGTIVYEKVCK